jgi:hypothetical protein
LRLSQRHCVQKPRGVLRAELRQHGTTKTVSAQAMHNATLRCDSRPPGRRAHRSEPAVPFLPDLFAFAIRLPSLYTACVAGDPLEHVSARRRHHCPQSSDQHAVALSHVGHVLSRNAHRPRLRSHWHAQSGTLVNRMQRHSICRLRALCRGRGIVARGAHAASQGRAVDGHLRSAACADWSCRTPTHRKPRSSKSWK